MIKFFVASQFLRREIVSIFLLNNTHTQMVFHHFLDQEFNVVKLEVDFCRIKQNQFSFFRWSRLFKNIYEEMPNAMSKIIKMWGILPRCSPALSVKH